MRKHTPFPWSSQNRFSYSHKHHNKKEGEEEKQMGSQMDAINEVEDDPSNKKITPM